MFRFINRYFKSSSKVIYPDRCPFCNKLINRNDYACEKCKSDIPQDGIIQGISGGYRCVSTFVHQDKFRRALLHFKFKGKTQYSSQLAFIMFEEIKRSYPDMIFDVITYVPMHKRSEFFRGYNQCELLSKNLSNMMKIPYKPLLSKVKHTKPQHKLEAKKRKTNLKGVFRVIDKKDIKGKNILLLDDIVTTGTTLAECTKTLSKAKPQSIYCITLSRAE